MKTFTLPNSLFKSLCFTLLLTALSLTGFAQMKIGNHPTAIMKASILELESPNQALRLTRVYDTSAVEDNIPTGTEADSANGMIVFQTRDSSLYLRAGGWWHRIIDSSELAGNFWSLNGNNGTDSATNFIGTKDPMGLRIVAGNTNAILISRTGIVKVVDSLDVGGDAGFTKNVNIADSLLVGSALHVMDSVTLKTVRDALPTDTSVLVISNDGIVRKMSLNSLGIRTVNGIGGPNLMLEFGSDSLKSGVNQHGPWIDSLSGSDTTLVLQLPDASPSVRGLVDTVSQSFEGVKTFIDSVAVGTTDGANATLDIQGNVNTKVAFVSPLDNYDMSGTSGANLLKSKVRTIIYDVSAVAVASTYTVTLPDAVDGRIYTIKKVGKAADNQIDVVVQVSPGSGKFGDGSTTSFPIYNNFTSVTVQAHGGNWYIVAH